MIIPLAMFPTLTQVHPISKAHHPNPSVYTQSVPHLQSTTPAPYVKISPFEQHSGSAYQLPAQTSLQAVRFVPCLCSSGKDDRWSKTNYQASAQFASPAPFQVIHLLPCYCTVVREVDTQYVQPVVAPLVDQVASNTVQSTPPTKS